VSLLVVAAFWSLSLTFWELTLSLLVLVAQAVQTVTIVCFLSLLRVAVGVVAQVILLMVSLVVLVVAVHLLEQGRVLAVRADKIMRVSGVGLGLLLARSPLAVAVEPARPEILTALALVVMGLVLQSLGPLFSALVVVVVAQKERLLLAVTVVVVLGTL
jgi:hypothetical protein